MGPNDFIAILFVLAVAVIAADTFKRKTRT